MDHPGRDMELILITRIDMMWDLLLELEFVVLIPQTGSENWNPF